MQIADVRHEHDRRARGATHLDQLSGQQRDAARGSGQVPDLIERHGNELVIAGDISPPRRLRLRHADRIVELQDRSVCAAHPARVAKS